MRDKLVTTFALTGAMAAILSGCVSNPNAMVFGTNTVLGISAGASATNAPGITVGYKRQEAVVMPLVANVSMNGEKLTACNLEKAEAGKEHPCVMRGTETSATNGVDDKPGEQTDSLSVLASFGTKYGANASTAAEVNGSITQYFATGLAARRLAERAGIGAVAPGPAALASALSSPEMERAIAGLPEGQSTKDVAAKTIALDAIATNVKNAGDADYVKLLEKMDADSGSKRFKLSCAKVTTASACALLISKSNLLSYLPPDVLEAAAKSKL